MTRNRQQTPGRLGPARDDELPLRDPLGRCREMTVSVSVARHRDRIRARALALATGKKIRRWHEASEIRGGTHCIHGIGRLNLEFLHSGSDRLCTLKEVGVNGFPVRQFGLV